MDFFNKLSDKVVSATQTASEKVMSATQSASEKAKEVADITKLQYEKSSCESNVTKKYAELGKLFFESKPEVIAPEFVEAFNEIEELKARIAELETEIITKKGGATCPSCGAVNTNGNAFCTSCGNKLEDETVEAEPVAEEEPAAEETTEE